MPVPAPAGPSYPSGVLFESIVPERVRSDVSSAAAVVGFALLTAAAAQLTIPLGFTPVPLTGQTFAVLLSGAVLGSRRGALSQLLYVALGAIGLPFYAGAEGGWQAATGSTAGYLIGFVVAAFVVGAMAERGQDRRLPTALPAFLAGTMIIYGFGALWLAQSLGVPLAAEAGQPSAVAYGVAPFLVGDLIKAALAGLLVPATWRLVERST